MTNDQIKTAIESPENMILELARYCIYRSKMSRLGDSRWTTENRKEIIEFIDNLRTQYIINGGNPNSRTDCLMIEIIADFAAMLAPMIRKETFSRCFPIVKETTEREIRTFLSHIENGELLQLY